MTGAATFILILLAAIGASAQEGYYGKGHEKWHEGFYLHLRSPSGVQCCSLTDCRPTTGRAVGDHYEVMVNGVWIRVLPEKVVKTTAPDQGYHVCAPQSFPDNPVPDRIYCVVLPPET